MQGGSLKIKQLHAFGVGHGYVGHAQKAEHIKHLEAHQFIARTVHPGPPVVMEYHVLLYARSLDPVIKVLKA